MGSELEDSCASVPLLPTPLASSTLDSGSSCAIARSSKKSVHVFSLINANLLRREASRALIEGGVQHDSSVASFPAISL